MRSEILVLKNTIFWYKIQIFGYQNTIFCFSKLAGLSSERYAPVYLKYVSALPGCKCSKIVIHDEFEHSK